MPIQKYLNTTSSGSGLARIAKLHKGLPKSKKKRESDGKEIEIVGRDTDYFRVVFADGYEHLSADFTQMYGEKPTQLPVMLNADTALEALDFWYEDYDSRGTMLHRCDGVNQAVCYNASTGYYEHNQPCITPSCTCKQVARLELVLPEFTMLTGVMGTITMETHSDQDIRTLIARLTTYANLFGTLRGVPLILYRAKKDTSSPKTDRQGKRTGERVNVTRAMIDIQVDPDFARAKLMGALTGAFNARSLPHMTNHDTSNVVVSPDEARLALSTGPRRIETEQPADIPQLQSHWTSDTARWKGFLDWAAIYGCSQLDVLDALEAVAEGKIEAPADWTGDELRAMAAVIARVCDYKLDKIAKYTIKKVGAETQATIRAHAKAMAEAHAQALIEPDEVDAQ